MQRHQVNPLSLLSFIKQNAGAKKYPNWVPNDWPMVHCAERRTCISLIAVWLIHVESFGNTKGVHFSLESDVLFFFWRGKLHGSSLLGLQRVASVCLARDDTAAMYTTSMTYATSVTDEGFARTTITARLWSHTASPPAHDIHVHVVSLTRPVTYSYRFAVFPIQEYIHSASTNSI